MRHAALLLIATAGCSSSMGGPSDAGVADLAQAGPLRAPGGMVADARGVFVVDEDIVGAVLLFAPDLQNSQIVAGGSDALHVVGPLVGDATNLYFGAATASGIGLFSMPRAGGAPVMLASSDYLPRVAAVDAQRLYWATAADPSVYSVSTAGGARATVSTSLHGVDGLALDANFVYWNSRGAVGDAGGDVEKAPLAGGTPVVIAAQQNGATSVAVDDTSVYWFTQDYGVDCTPTNAMLWQMPKDGSAAPVQIANQSLGAFGLVIDGAQAWFLSAGSWCNVMSTATGAVLKSPLATPGTPTPIATTQVSPSCFALDAAHIYWAAQISLTNPYFELRSAPR
jgi:hypothetical protein